MYGLIIKKKWLDLIVSGKKVIEIRGSDTKRQSVSYLYQNPALTGEKCPCCGHKSWEIFKCDKCRTIFCRHCKLESVVVTNDETGDIDVICPNCKSETLFIDM